MAKLMEIHGMKGIRTEWWHFSLKTEKAPLDAWEWACE
jgi:D-alanyl-D-alanine dipeptidase